MSFFYPTESFITTYAQKNEREKKSTCKVGIYSQTHLRNFRHDVNLGINSADHKLKETLQQWDFMVSTVDKLVMKRKKSEASSYQASSACLKITGSATLLGHTHRHTRTLWQQLLLPSRHISHGHMRARREMLSRLTLKKNLNVRLGRTSEGRDSQRPVLIGGVAFVFLFTKSCTFTLSCSHLLREVCICAAAAFLFAVIVYLFILCPYVAISWLSMCSHRVSICSCCVSLLSTTISL